MDMLKAFKPTNTKSVLLQLPQINGAAIISSKSESNNKFTALGNSCPNKIKP